MLEYTNFDITSFAESKLKFDNEYPQTNSFKTTPLHQFINTTNFLCAV